MEALRGATYEELVDSGVRPVHAKLILSNLGSRHQLGSPLPPATAYGDDASDEIKHFLRSIGLENCAADLASANYRTLDQLGEASMHDLLNAGLKPVHARLISSNLDNPSSVALHMTPAAQRLASMEAEETLLPGGTSKRRSALPCPSARAALDLLNCHPPPCQELALMPFCVRSSWQTAALCPAPLLRCPPPHGHFGHSSHA